MFCCQSCRVGSCSNCCETEEWNDRTTVRRNMIYQKSARVGDTTDNAEDSEASGCTNMVLAR